MDIQRAQQIWSEYQREHDVSMHLGETAGIDPISGRVWIGESALAVRRQLEAEGLSILLYFVRVGRDYYYRKGGRRG